MEEKPGRPSWPLRANPSTLVSEMTYKIIKHSCSEFEPERLRALRTVGGVVPGSPVRGSPARWDVFGTDGGHVEVCVRVCEDAVSLPRGSHHGPLQARLLMPSPRRPVLVHHLFDRTASCSERRERAGGSGTITDWTPLSRHGRRPRKLSRCCESRVRLSTRWGGFWVM